MKKILVSIVISMFLLGGLTESASGQEANNRQTAIAQGEPVKPSTQSQPSGLDTDVEQKAQLRASIIGGNPTSYNDHPYFVAVRSSSGRCSGSLIDPSWVLTAAHCVADDPTIVTARFASNETTVSEVIVHPLWNTRETFGHDLALLRVDPRASRGAQPIRVGAPFRADAYAVGRSAELVGIGVTEPGGESGSMNEVTIPIVSDSEVEASSLRWDRPDLLFGAGTPTKGACDDDSGGPLSTFLDGQRVQIGVTSFGTLDCNGPTVFSELDNAHLAWIASEVPGVAQGWSRCHPRVTPGFYYLDRLGPKQDRTMAIDRVFSWDITCGPAPEPEPFPVLLRTDG